MSNWNKIYPPWSRADVLKLNQFQTRGLWHPFTCPNNSMILLLATSDGWICEHCSYTQNWAWEFQLG